MKKDEGIIHIAQKGLIFDKPKSNLLVVQYVKATYVPEKIQGKLGLPGGQIDFGEDPDPAFIREIKEETGITIIPKEPFHIWTWIYTKKSVQHQIVAVARIGEYKSGTLIKGTKELESSIEPKWIDLKKLYLHEFIEDEQPIIKQFMNQQ